MIDRHPRPSPARRLGREIVQGLRQFFDCRLQRTQGSSVSSLSRGVVEIVLNITSLLLKVEKMPCDELMRISMPSEMLRL